MIGLAVRLLLLGAAVVSGPRLAREGSRELGATLATGIFIVFALIGLLAVLALASFIRLGPERDRLWGRPSWRAMPILGEPLQLVHAFGWYFMAAGLVALLIAATSTQQWLGGSTAAGVGAGLLGGCHAFVRLRPTAFRACPGSARTRTARKTAP